MAGGYGSRNKVGELTSRTQRIENKKPKLFPWDVLMAVLQEEGSTFKVGLPFQLMSSRKFFTRHAQGLS